MLLLLATAILASMGFAYVQVRGAAVYAAKDRLARVTDQMTELLRVGAITVKVGLAPQARQPDLREFLLTPSPVAQARALAVLESVRAKSTQIVDVELWGAAGQTVLSIGAAGSAMPPLVRHELLSPPSMGDSAVLGSLHLAGGVPLFAAGAPIREDGRTIGYLVERGRLAASPAAAHALGDLIGNAAGVFVGNIRGDVFSDFWLAVDGPSSIPDKPGEVFQYQRRGGDGGPQYALAKVIPATPWLMLVELPQERVLAPVTMFLRNATLFALFLLVIGAISLWLLSRNITRPLNALRAAAVALTDGDYSHELDLSRADELGELSRAFDEMANQVSGAQQALTRKLAAIEGQYWVLVDGIKDYAIFMLDSVGNVVSWNKGAERIKGYTAEEIIGQHFSRFYSAEDIAARTPWKELEIARNDGCYETDGWRVHKNGLPTWASIVITALRDQDGNLVGFAKVVRDISDRKKAIENQEAHTHALEKAYVDLDRNRHELKVVNEDLEAFTYSVSHDLRAPIRQIEGFSKILEEHLGDADPQAAQYLTRVRQGSQQMGRLVDDLLSFAQLGRQPRKPKAESLSGLVDEVLVNVRSEITDRSIEWRINPLPPAVCDAGLMKVVFTNLLSNAVKYTRPREKAVIEIGHLVKNRQVIVYVRDNGVGFDMKYADKLFGVFQRLHRAEEFEGTGVGLATVHRIIRKHNGLVWAESSPGAGSTFFFTLGVSSVDHDLGSV